MKRPRKPRGGGGGFGRRPGYSDKARERARIAQSIRQLLGEQAYLAYARSGTYNQSALDAARRRKARRAPKRSPFGRTRGTPPQELFRSTDRDLDDLDDDQLKSTYVDALSSGDAAQRKRAAEVIGFTVVDSDLFDSIASAWEGRFPAASRTPQQWNEYIDDIQMMFKRDYMELQAALEDGIKPGALPKGPGGSDTSQPDFFIHSDTTRDLTHLIETSEDPGQTAHDIVQAANQDRLREYVENFDPNDTYDPEVIQDSKDALLKNLPLAPGSTRPFPSALAAETTKAGKVLLGASLPSDNKHQIVDPKALDGDSYDQMEAWASSVDAVVSNIAGDDESIGDYLSSDLGFGRTEEENDWPTPEANAAAREMAELIAKENPVVAHGWSRMAESDNVHGIDLILRNALTKHHPEFDRMHDETEEEVVSAMTQILDHPNPYTGDIEWIADNHHLAHLFPKDTREKASSAAKSVGFSEAAQEWLRATPPDG